MTSAKQIYLGSRRRPKLPYDAEVEYLQSSGTQYIDTGWVFQKNIRLVYDITYIGSGTFGRNAGSYEFFWSGSSFFFGGGRSTVTRSNNVRYEMDCDFTAGKMCFFFYNKYNIAATIAARQVLHLQRWRCRA